MTRLIATLIVTALSAGLVFAQQEKQGYNPFKGKTPPELTAPKDRTLNATEALRLAKLKGKPVLLVFTSVF